MIDIEHIVFGRVFKRLSEDVPNIFVTSDEILQPPKFPAVYIVERNNRQDRSYQTNSRTEQFSKVMYEVQVFTNDKVGKRQRAKEIMQKVDEEFEKMNFYRTLNQPISNLNDASISRRVARYEATVSKEGTIYRR